MMTTTKNYGSVQVSCVMTPTTMNVTWWMIHYHTIIVDTKTV